MTDEVKAETVSVELTQKDYDNIISWWTGATMMAEAGLRVSIRDSERDTISKISRVNKVLNKDVW